MFSVPWDTRRTRPCAKPAGAGGGLISPLPPRPGRAALICLRAEPTRIWLEATTELQLELFVAQTSIIKDYFSRFLFLLYQWSFVCESRVEIVGRPCFLTPIPAALIRTAA